MIDAETEERIIANPQSHGQPKFVTISGNGLLNMKGQSQIPLRKAFKAYIAPYIINQLVPFKEEDYPLRIQWMCYDVVDTADLGNMWFWEKWIFDLLQCREDDKDSNDNFGVSQIIPNDGKLRITQPGNAPRWIPVNNRLDRKFEWIFYRDDDPIIINHPLWRDQRTHEVKNTQVIHH